MSLNEFAVDTLKPWLNMRVNDLYLDDGFEVGCYQINGLLNSYFEWTGTTILPVPKSSFTGSLTYGNVNISLLTFASGIDNLEYDPLTLNGSITGVTIGPSLLNDTIIITNPGIYIVIANVGISTAATGELTFTASQFNVGENVYYVSDNSSGFNNSFVMHCYFELTSFQVPYNFQITCNHSTGSLTTEAGGMVTIFQL